MSRRLGNWSLDSDTTPPDAGDVRTWTVWLAISTSLLAACGQTPASSTSSSTTTPVPITTSARTTTAPTDTTTLPTTTTTTAPTTTSRPSTTSTTRPRPSDPAVNVWKIPTSEKVAVLTFDAGSDRGYAPQILDLLSTRGIKASFGMTGKWAEANPGLVQRMVDEGHTLINHTYDHPHMETLTTAERLAQLDRAETIIMNLTGVSTKPYFRPPYGSYNDDMLGDVGSAGYRYSIMWTIDSLGWKGISPAEVVERCLSRIEPGAIILMHVGALSTDYDALDSVMTGLVEAGYRFATIDEVLS